MSTPNKSGGRALFTPGRRIGLSRNYKSPVLSPRVKQTDDNPTPNIPKTGICVEHRSPNVSQNRRMGLSRSYKKLVQSPSALSDKLKIDENLSEPCADTNTLLTPCKKLGMSKVSESPPIIDCTKNESIIKWRDDSIMYNDLSKSNICKTPPNKQLSLATEIPKTSTELNIDDLVPVTEDKTKELYNFKVHPSPSGSKIVIKRSRLSLKRKYLDTIESQETENLKCDVEVLDGKVREKEKTLSRLQQCAIYKQSQDLSTLTTLTETWKNGCELAIRRIFTKFKGTSDINMDALLMRLNVPKDILQYHSESDEFTWTLI